MVVVVVVARGGGQGPSSVSSHRSPRNVAASAGLSQSSMVVRGVGFAGHINKWLHVWGPVSHRGQMYYFCNNIELCSF